VKKYHRIYFMAVTHPSRVLCISGTIRENIYLFQYYCFFNFYSIIVAGIGHIIHTIFRLGFVYACFMIVTCVDAILLTAP
jgi:hypothetical protein